MEEQSRKSSFPKVLFSSIVFICIGIIVAFFTQRTSVLSQSIHTKALADNVLLKPIPSTTPNVPSPTAMPTPTPTPTPSPTPEPSPTPTPAGQSPLGGALPTADPTNDTVWDSLAQCESGGNWGEDTGNGYYGGLQFNQTAWESVGGSGSPAQASRTEQISRGKLLQNQRGWSPWHGCGKKLGLY